MNYNVAVNTNTGRTYQFILSRKTADDFVEFVNGAHKEQFFTIIAGGSCVMLSRKSIEYVLIEQEEKM